MSSFDTLVKSVCPVALYPPTADKVVARLLSGSLLDSLVLPTALRARFEVEVRHSMRRLRQKGEIL